MVYYEPLVPAVDPIELRIPPSTSTVKISAIDTGARFKLPISKFLVPHVAGKDHLTGPAFSFLIEHPSGRKVLFDLSIIRDLTQYPTGIQDSIRDGGWTVETKKDVVEVLEEHGIRPDEIEAIIWSHHHWDHTGAPYQFPPTTALVVGPGFKENLLPGWPEDPKSRVLSRSWKDRELREVSFESSSAFRIGRFKALDFFGDGSFYLLDTPGHEIGHICALARDTTDSFVYLGGDVCHHSGEYRPTQYLPLPAKVPPGMVPRLRAVCPGSVFRDLHPAGSATAPYYSMTPTFPHEFKAAEWSIEGTEEFDAHDNVLVVLAHDESVLDILEFFPKSLNGWKEKQLARKAKWAFLGDFDVQALT